MSCTFPLERRDRPTGDQEEMELPILLLVLPESDLPLLTRFTPLNSASSIYSNPFSSPRTLLPLEPPSPLLASVMPRTSAPEEPLEPRDPLDLPDPMDCLDRYSIPDYRYPRYRISLRTATMAWTRMISL